MTQHIFVYGTLRKDVGNSMFHLLARHARFVGNARVPGRLYDLGDYPGVVLSADQAPWVHGEVYALEDADEVLARLDEYEGCGPDDSGSSEFERIMHDASLEDGRMIRAWIYVYRGVLEGKPEISSGAYFGRAL